MRRVVNKGNLSILIQSLYWNKKCEHSPFLFCGWINVIEVCQVCVEADLLLFPFTLKKKKGKNVQNGIFVVNHLFSHRGSNWYNCSLFRILGSLISAHILLTDPRHPFGDIGLKDYDNELLHLAHDLAVRLLPAFENTSTGIPYPRVRPTYIELF